VARVIDDLMGTNAYLEAGALHRLMEEGETVSGAYLAVDPTRSAELYRRLKATPRVAGVLRQNAARESLDKTMAETVGTVRVFNVAFALIIAFGVVYNSARITLAERSRELATLRVIGFHRTEIAYILLGEIAVLTLAAVPTGMLLGYGLAAATAGAMNTEVYRIPLVVSPRTFAFAAITILLATAVSSLVVRRRLDRLDLVAVLKTRE
jgi:putative ABC transport system permease protein